MRDENPLSIEDLKHSMPHAFILTEMDIDCLKQNGYFLETQVGIDVVGKVLSVLSDAGLNSDRVVIQSEDSAVLKRISQTDNYTLAYRVVETNVTINTDVVTEIKALATYATLPRGLIQQTYQDYLLNNSHVVDEFHAQNVSVFVSYLRNIFITLAFDYESDPTAEIDTMVQIFKVDGLITTSPATAKAYLSTPTSCHLSLSLFSFVR